MPLVSNFINLASYLKIRTDSIQILPLPSHLDQSGSEIFEHFLLFNKVFEVKVVGGGFDGFMHNYGICPELHQKLSFSLLSFPIEPVFFHDSEDFPFHKLILIEFSLFLSEKLVHLLSIKPLLLINIR